MSDSTPSNLPASVESVTTSAVYDTASKPTWMALAIAAVSLCSPLISLAIGPAGILCGCVGVRRKKSGKPGPRIWIAWVGLIVNCLITGTIYISSLIEFFPIAIGGLIIAAPIYFGSRYWLQNQDYRPQLGSGSAPSAKPLSLSLGILGCSGVAALAFILGIMLLIVGVGAALVLSKPERSAHEIALREQVTKALSTTPTESTEEKLAQIGLKVAHGYALKSNADYISTFGLQFQDFFIATAVTNPQTGNLVTIGILNTVQFTTNASKNELELPDPDQYRLFK